VTGSATKSRLRDRIVSGEGMVTACPSPIVRGRDRLQRRAGNYSLIACRRAVSFGIGRSLLALAARRRKAA
jgi:hypothetical protein